MTEHPLERLIQTGEYNKIDSYFPKQHILTNTEKEYLLSGLRSKNWRVRHRCAKYLRIGTLSQKDAEALQNALSDGESSVANEALLSLMHYRPMHEKISAIILKKKAHLIQGYGSYGLLLEDIFKKADEVQLIQARFSDFTDQILQYGAEKKQGIFKSTFISAAKYAALIAPGRPSTIKRLFQIIEKDHKEYDLKYMAFNTLCQSNLTEESDLHRLYTLLPNFSQGVSISNLLLFAKHYCKTEEQRRVFLITALMRFKEVDEDMSSDLLELRELLKIDAERCLQDQEIQKLNNGVFSKSVFSVLIHGKNPFDDIPLKLEEFLDCHFVSLSPARDSNHLYLVPTEKLFDTKWYAQKKIVQSQLNNLERRSEFSIFSNAKTQQIRIRIPYGWETNFSYSPEGYSLSFYGGIDRWKQPKMTYELYFELAKRQAQFEAFRDSTDSLISELFYAITLRDFSKIEPKWLWVEENLGKYFEETGMISSFALSLLDIHAPLKTPRTRLQGTMIQFYKAQTTQETLLYRLLVELPASSAPHTQLWDDFELFFADFFAEIPSNDVLRCFQPTLEAIKTEAEASYTFWLEWFSERCQNEDLLHSLSVWIMNLNINTSVSVLRSLIEKSNNISTLLISNMRSALTKLGDQAQLKEFNEQYSQSKKNKKQKPNLDEDPTIVPADFDINAAMARMAHLNDKMVTEWNKRQKFSAIGPFLPEAIFLQLRILHYWLPHPLSGKEYPQGRATSAIMTNYLFYLIDQKEFDEAFAFLKKHLENKTIFAAQLRDFPRAEGIFSAVIQLAYHTEKEEHQAFAIAVMDWVLKHHEIKQGWSYIFLAVVYIWKDDIEAALDSVEKAVWMDPESKRSMQEDMETYSCYKPLHAEPRYQAIFG